jgi:rhamnulose-1-phosphate aldolase
LPEALPGMANQFVLITGTGRRMRDISKKPEEHTMIVRVAGDGKTYSIYYTSSTKDIKPSSELATHLACHNFFKANKPQITTIMHAHPTDLISFSHNPKMVSEEIINKSLWKMHPETVVFAPNGIGFIPYQIPGNAKIANATIKKLATNNIILWQKHGAFATGVSLTIAFDIIDTLNKSAHMYLQCLAAGYEPSGLTDAEIEEIKIAYKDFI